MIVSHACKFIFLKTEKTAGTAIEAAIELCSPPISYALPGRGEGDRKARPRKSHRTSSEATAPAGAALADGGAISSERRLYEHAAWRVRAYVGEEIWRDYFKFAFVRNPWDRQISQYLYKTKSKARRPSLERFMARKKRAYVTSYEIYTIEGEVVVDYMGRYESLEEDLRTALKRAGVESHLEVPRTNVTSDRDRESGYRSYYGPRTRALVADWYAREIALLGYRF
jgi:hypothetical protein